MALDTRSIYVSSLQSTHGLEMMALQIMQRQVERLEHYPEMEAALRRHIAETHGQRDRLEDALAAMDAKPSTVKEGVLGMIGNVMALGHVPAQDEILKNAFANQAFENFEIAAYTSLLTIAEAAGQSAYVSAFRASLAEEQAMARTVADLVAPTTQRYIALSTAGETASH